MIQIILLFMTILYLFIPAFAGENINPLIFADPSPAFVDQNTTTQQTTTLRAEISDTWTVDTARGAAFKNAIYRINTSGIPSTDPNFLENKIALSINLNRIKDRTLTKFFGNCDCSYGVKIDHEPEGLYYNKKGRLVKISYMENEEDVHYPNKVYQYSYPNGHLKYITITVDHENQYMFNSKGDLKTHWIGNIGYDEYNNPVGRRETQKF